jgi:hypothetical protein
MIANRFENYYWTHSHYRSSHTPFGTRIDKALVMATIPWLTPPYSPIFGRAECSPRAGVTGNLTYFTRDILDSDQSILADMTFVTMYYVTNFTYLGKLAGVATEAVLI